MGKYLPLFEALAGKADNISVTGRAVQPIMPIQDNVLGAFDSIETDDFGSDQTVVLRVWRAAAACYRCHRGKRQHRWIDINLLNDLAAILRPFDVDADGCQEDDAGDGGRDVAGDTDTNETVGHDKDDDGADHCPPHRATPAGDRRATNDDRGQCLEFPADAGGRVRAALAGRVKDSAGGTQQAREYIGREQHALDANSSVARRFAAGADRGEMPAIARAAQKNMPDK